MKKLLLPAVLLGAAAAALLLATYRPQQQPHMRLFAEMSKSPAPGAQSLSQAVPGTALHRPLPYGTLARGPETPRFGPGADERARAARTLKNPVAVTHEALLRGRTTYARFCAQCHGPKGRGDGGVAKAFPGLSFSLAGKSSYDLADGEIFHIISHGRNAMPPHSAQIPVEDRWSLVHYLRDLQRAEIARLGPLAETPEDPRRLNLVSADYGKELYAQNCASCHGEKGRAPVPGVPTLNLPSALSIADDDFYFNIISHGRKGTQMPAWEKALTRTQMLSVVRYLRSWNTKIPDRDTVLAQRGEPSRGEALYRGRCAACHGRRGEGGIGNTLNSPSFLSIASPQFFRDMIIGGRKHTAMPASYDLSTEEIADLVAYLRSWSKPRHDYAKVKELLPAANAATGAKIYAGKCSACHGERGQGGVGSRLDSQSFLAMADDRFLFRAVSEGRPGTAMPSWYQLSSQDMADLLAFLRSWQKVPAVAVDRAPRRGEPEFGRLIYDRACVSCHGPEGRGGVGGQLGNPVFLSSASDEFLWRSIAHGKQGSRMRGFLEGHSVGALMSLNSSDIDHVVAYLRTLQGKSRVELLDREFPGTSAKVGRELYAGKAGCARCHGDQGEGASGPSLNTEGFLKAASNGYLAATILMGRDGTEMKAFNKHGSVVSLDPYEVLDIVAYIRSWETDPPKARRAIDRTAGSIQDGRQLYGRYCQSCHGVEGKATASTGVRGYAPSLNTPEFLAAADDGFLMATIAIGRPNTAMRPFGPGAGGVAELSASDIRKIVAYMRSWQEEKK